MITDVYIVYQNEKDKDEITSVLSPFEPVFVHYIDELTREGKRKGYMLKSEYGARLSPFVLMLDKEDYVKAFYSEVKESVVNQIIQYGNTEA